MINTTSNILITIKHSDDEEVRLKTQIDMIMYNHNNSTYLRSDADESSNLLKNTSYC